MSLQAERVDIERVIERVAAAWAIPAEALRAPCRQPEHREAWGAAAYAAWELTGLCSTDIGKALGGADHTRVIMAREKTRTRAREDQALRRKLEIVIQGA